MEGDTVAAAERRVLVVAAAESRAHVRVQELALGHSSTSMSEGRRDLNESVRAQNLQKGLCRSSGLGSPFGGNRII